LLLYIAAVTAVTAIFFGGRVQKAHGIITMLLSVKANLRLGHAFLALAVVFLSVGTWQVHCFKPANRHLQARAYALAYVAAGFAVAFGAGLAAHAALGIATRGRAMLGLGEKPKYTLW
jgi:hypothetical protein